ncbi:MAG: adenosylcobinamide-GDP ribazoletransferase [Sulfurimonas sp.]|nr:adenosylcobinamide-GDP ribazoletransferase [Sulfurimonas sp.]
MKKALKGFALSINMLTIIPFFKVHDFYKGINAYAVLFYPLVGYLLGLLLYFTHYLLSDFFSGSHLGIIIFALLVVLTGALHLDGFSDTIDGLFVSKQKALKVMKDPHAGGMGMVFSIVFLLLKASTFMVFEVFYLLPIVLMFSRFNIVLAIYFFPYISKNGMGTLAKEELHGSHVFIAFCYVMVLSLFSFWLFVLSIAVLYLLKTFFIKRYGGFSGDIYGFSIELTELVLLNAILLGVGV